MKLTRWTVSISLTVATIGLSVPNVGVAGADPATIDFIVPQGTSVPTGTNRELILFTGQEPGSTEEVGNCAPPGTYPIHDVRLINPAGGGSATGGVEVTVTSQTSPVPAGTRLATITQLSPCGTTGEFAKYRGEVVEHGN